MLDLRRRARPRCRLRPALVVALLWLLWLPGGCGGDDGDARVIDEGAGHLDPPSLAVPPADDGEPGVPVLCYHYFRPRFAPGYYARVVGSVIFGLPALGPREFWTTPVGEFEKHLRYLRDHDIRSVTLDEVADAFAGGRPLPPRAVVLTIDDADRSVYEHAYPLLRQYGVRAHLFVPTAHVGRPWSGLDVCSWDELREMAASGTVLIESHTRNLHFKVRGERGPEPVFWRPQRVPEDLRRATLIELAGLARTPAGLDLSPALQAALAGPYGPVAADLLASRLDIAREIGVAPRWLAWPYGFAPVELEVVGRAAGFRGTVSLAPSRFGPGGSDRCVSRFTLTAKSTLSRIAAAVEVP